MHDRTVWCFLAVLLVAIAGCTGLPAGDPTGGSAAEENTQPSTPPGPPRDVTDVSEIHRNALRSEGSFTVERNETIRIVRGDEQTTTHVLTTTQFDLESGRAMLVQNRTTAIGPPDQAVETSQTASTYRTSDGVVYTRETRFDEILYTSGDDALAGPTLNDTRALTPGAIQDESNVSFVYEGAGSVAGEEGYVFAARGVDAAPPSFESAEATLESFQVLVLTDSTGRVRATSISLSLRQDEGRVSLTQVTRYTDVGTTTVEPPPWLEEARTAVAG